MTRSTPVLAIVLAMSVAAASAGERPARRAQPDDRNRRCAAEGQGFVYSKEANMCVRLGGMVGVGVSVGSGQTLYGR
jgi:hypothetical protein